MTGNFDDEYTDLCVCGHRENQHEFEELDWKLWCSECDCGRYRELAEAMRNLE